MPPDPEELSRRLAVRSTDDAEEVTRRLITAKNEMEQRGHYDHIVVNDDLDATVQKIKELITASAKKADPGTDCNSEPELREV